MKILVINGPNLNLLGTREPEFYGTMTLDDINFELIEYSKTLSSDIELEFFQSNFEGDIVEKIQKTDAKGIIINPAAYTHTSIAIADSIRAVKVKTVEVHLSNIQSREYYRKTSYVSSVSMGTISGFKQNGYKMALFALYNELK